MTAFPSAAVISATPSRSFLDRLIAGLLVATLAVDGAFLVGLVVTGGDHSPVVNVGLSLASQWVPVSLFWVVAVRTRFRSTPVLLIAAGVTFSAIGDSYYSLAMDAEGYLAFPSPADVGYVLFYPLLLAALVLLVPRESRRISGLVLLETAVATLGAAALLAVVLAPVIDEALAGESPLGAAIATAYPLFDLIILAVIAGVAALPVAVGGRWPALVAGLGVFAVADIAYALLESRDAYVAGTPLDASWAFGLGLIAWWAAGMASSPRPVRPARVGYAPLPTLAVAAGLTVLVLASITPVPVLAVVLAALTVGLAAVPIVFRQAMLGRLVAAQDAAVHRLTELDREKSALLATVNHEFRTPLTSINGHVELLLDGAAGELPPAAAAMLRTVERNGDRLQRLVDEAFAASRPVAPAVTRLASIPVAEVVAATVADAGDAAARQGVQLVVEGDSPSPVVEADPEQLTEALGELIGNAVKFTAPGGRIDLSTETAGAEVVVTVRDTGMGIPEDEIDRIFTDFFRASNARRAAIPGVGLGLATAQRIVRAHGGEIDVESTGRGTVVTVRLPRHVTD